MTGVKTFFARVKCEKYGSCWAAENSFAFTYLETDRFDDDCVCWLLVSFQTCASDLSFSYDDVSISTLIKQRNSLQLFCGISIRTMVWCAERNGRKHHYVICSWRWNSRWYFSFLPEMWWFPVTHVWGRHRAGDSKIWSRVGSRKICAHVRSPLEVTRLSQFVTRGDWPWHSVRSFGRWVYSLSLVGVGVTRIRTPFCW